MFDSITGKGAKADHDNETYYVGNKKLLAENNIAIAGELQDRPKNGANSLKPLSGLQTANRLLL
jgi:Cu2+-exporting ATPase